MDVLSVSSDQWNGWIDQFFLPLTRILALIATAPLIGQAAVPLQARLGLGLALTFVIAPGIDPHHGVSLASAEGGLLILEQILVGAVLGFSVNLIFAAVTMAGELSGLQMGLGFASFYDPLHATFQPLIGQFLNILFSLIFLSLDGHLLVIDALADSFRTVPLEPALHLHAQGWHMALALASTLFAEAIRLSLPILAALMITNLALGVLTRAAPQLNLFAVGFPVTLAVGFIVLDFSLPTLPALAERIIRSSLVASAGLIQRLLY
ncbi:MAG: flagellar biosynthetic protein FliR [Ferrovum sp.]|nr:flagellar biosynthetic protein FliR [Ferrovum sp.]NDU88085.1 flagellar biosynthetic protein FliR [Ferrovum sp.]